MGEHAAVYGRPALVAAIDRRLWVEIEAASGEGVRLDLPQVGVAEELEWSEILAYTRRARDAWHEYVRKPDAASFREVGGDDPAHLVKVALGEAAEALDDDRPPPVVVHVDSEIPVGSGFGSSAAAAVATVAAFLAFRGLEPELGEVERVALEAERRQHGQPSGVDGATVLHGGLLWAERDGEGWLRAEPLDLRPDWLRAVRVFQSGLPRESTGAVVAAVGERVAADRERLGAVIDRMEEATRELRADLGDAAVAAELIRRFEACLEELGVVPEPVRRVVRQVEARGGAAKISGAGALSGAGAGSLLVYAPESAEIERWEFLGVLDRLDLGLGAEGLRREEA